MPDPTPPLTAEQRAAQLLACLRREPAFAEADIIAALADAETAAAERERMAILRTLQMVHAEHCATKEEARGVHHAIDCVRARSAP